MRKFPPIPDELLEALEKKFPDKTPRDVNTTSIQLGVKIGHQEVLDYLRHLRTKQNILEG